MSYPTNDTEWAISAKGNTWKRKNGIAMAVGLNTKTDKYWARRGNEFVKVSFDTKQSAMYAAEFDVDGYKNDAAQDDQWGGESWY